MRGSGQETHAPAVTWLRPGPPLAENARTARFYMDRCAGCGLPVEPGQRVADLADGAGIVHVACVAAALTAAAAALAASVPGADQAPGQAARPGRAARARRRFPHSPAPGAGPAAG
jgi:hypothetical protein